MKYSLVFNEKLSNRDFSLTSQNTGTEINVCELFSAENMAVQGLLVKWRWAN